MPNTTFKRKPANEKSSHKTLWRAQPRNKISFLRGGYFPVGCKLPGFISMIKALGNHAQSFQPQESEGKNRKTSLIFPPATSSHPSNLSHPWPLSLFHIFHPRVRSSASTDLWALLSGCSQSPRSNPWKGTLPFVESPIKDVNWLL